MNKDSTPYSDDSFKAISDFLTAFTPEVSARSSDEITPEFQTKLSSLAAGELGEDEGREISRELLSNEAALKTLANMLSQEG